MMIESTIICVDDEWIVLKSLGAQLKRQFGKHYCIELVNSAETALELCAELKAENREIALIISDQKMTGMNGDALLIQLHTLYPKTLKIMLTGHADADSVGNVINQATLYRYIRKPWDETDLIMTVTEALRRFQQEQQLSEQNTLLKMMNARLASSLSILLATLDATADGILILDNQGQIVSFNRQFISIFQLEDLESSTNGDRLIQAILTYLTVSDGAKFQSLFRPVDQPWQDSLKLQCGKIIEFYLQPYQLAGAMVGGVISFRDVTEIQQRTEVIQHQALHDALTNLPNRILFQQKLATSLHEAAKYSKLMALMFLDLDRFKAVNDNLGHAIGDLLLQSVVQRLVECLREDDVIARWGGDEFVLLLPQIRRREDATEIAQRLTHALQPEFSLQNCHFSITASIGIAVYPYDGVDHESLLQSADSALYHVKKSGRNNYQHFVRPAIAE
jgi:diguanylate cyclase (GGDEF)-like protein